MQKQKKKEDIFGFFNQWQRPKKKKKLNTNKISSKLNEARGTAPHKINTNINTTRKIENKI